MRWGWERLAALAGVIPVVLWVIGVLIQESSDMPGDEPTGEQLLSWYVNDEQTIVAAAFVFMLGALFFLVFLGALRVRLLAAEGPAGFLTTIAFAAGVAVGIFLLMLPAPDMAAALSNDELSPDAALAVNTLGDMFFLGAELSAALLLAAAGLLFLQTRVLQVWLGWAGLLLGFPLWTILVAVLLWMRPVVGEPVTARPPEPIH